MSNAVTSIPAADAALSRRHFADRLRFETDCWDVHASLADAEPGFVLLDVRAPGLFARGHIAGAINLPHASITGERLNAWPAETLFVVYCAGPHCRRRQYARWARHRRAGRRWRSCAAS